MKKMVFVNREGNVAYLSRFVSVSGEYCWSIWFSNNDNILSFESKKDAEDYLARKGFKVN